MLNEVWSIVLSNFWFITLVSLSCAWLCALDGCLVVGAGALQRRFAVSAFKISFFLGLGHAFGAIVGSFFSASMGVMFLPLGLLSSIAGYSILLMLVLRSVFEDHDQHAHGHECKEVASCNDPELTSMHKTPRSIVQRFLTRTESYLLGAVMALSGDSLLFGEGFVGYLLKESLLSTIVISSLVAVLSGFFIGILTGITFAIFRRIRNEEEGLQSIWSRILLIVAAGVLVLMIFRLVPRLVTSLGLTTAGSWLPELVSLLWTFALCVIPLRGLSPKGFLFTKG